MRPRVSHGTQGCPMGPTGILIYPWGKQGYIHRSPGPPRVSHGSKGPWPMAPNGSRGILWEGPRAHSGSAGAFALFVNLCLSVYNVCLIARGFRFFHHCCAPSSDAKASGAAPQALAGLAGAAGEGPSTRCQTSDTTSDSVTRNSSACTVFFLCSKHP